MISSQSRKEPHHSFYTAKRKKLRCSFRVKTKIWEINTKYFEYFHFTRKGCRMSKNKYFGAWNHFYLEILRTFYFFINNSWNNSKRKKDHRGFRVSVLLWTTGLAVAARGLTNSCLQGVDSKGNSCYGSPRSPSMVRTRTYSSASPTTDAAITAEITRCKTNVGNNFSKAKQERHKIQRSFIMGRTAAGPLLLPP